MNMKKIFTLMVALMAMAGIARAQSDYVMVVVQNDGTQDTYELDGIEQISFAPYSWEEIAVGDYTFAYEDYDGEVFYDVDSNGEAIQRGLSLYRNLANPNFFKITHWTEYDHDFYFSYNETTDKFVDVDAMYVCPSDYYCDVICSDYWNYYSYGYEGAWSTYEPEEEYFRFCVVYSSACGYGIFGEGFEKFQITEFLNGNTLN